MSVCVLSASFSFLVRVLVWMEIDTKQRKHEAKHFFSF